MAKLTYQNNREGFCPVYDMPCPGGAESAGACDFRFKADYNPLSNFRDAEIQHCAIYQAEQREKEQNEER